jgi:hypothetical protein
MKGFIRKGLTAGLLAVAVVAGIAGPAAAAAREPGGNPGGGAVERPTPTNTTTPRQIESFSVSTDSVVATATLRYNGDPSAATVLWGDGTSTSRCPTGQVSSVHPGCIDGGGAAGTLVFKHRYAAPANGAPFTVAITGKLGAESQTVAIGVTPRYKVTVYDIEFSPLNHCDSSFEEETEWKVGRSVHENGTDVVPSREWNFDLLTNPAIVLGDWSLPDFKVLPGSGFSVELKASDHPELVLSAIELDPVLNDVLFDTGVDINPLNGSRSIELKSTGIASHCRAAYRFDVDVRLLEPGLDRGPVLSQ